MAVETESPTESQVVTTPARAGSVFYRSILEFFEDLPRDARRFWLLVMVTGAAAGLAGAGFLYLLRLVQTICWPSAGTYLAAIEAASPMRRVMVPTLAGLLITALWLITRRKLSGHGTPGVIEAIWRKEGRLSLPRAVLRDASSIVAVSMGAALGREGALIQTGAATGSWLAQRLQLSGAQARLLCACGAAAGIAAAYNVPIGGAVFGLEVLLGSFALELFGPIVISCVLGTMVSRLLIENHPAYGVPHYTLMTWHDVGLMPVLGLALGVTSALYVRCLDIVSVLLDKVPGKFAYAMPPLVMGALGFAAIWFPQLLGNGYDAVDLALLGTMPLGLLLLLPALKCLATAFCSSSGVPGGLFTPSMYVGALLGGGLGALVHLVWPGPTPLGAYALVGMGCILAGTTHAAVSSVLIVFELTGDYEVILPLMVACVIAAAVSRRLEPDSVYTAALRRRQVRLPEHPRPEWLAHTSVSSLIDPRLETVPPSLPFAQVMLRLIAQDPGRDLYVAAPDGRYLGVIALDTLKGHLPYWSDLSMLVAADVLDASLKPVTPDLSLAALRSRYADTYVDKLPVVDPMTGRLLGTVSKSQLFQSDFR
ncbi:MAG TPA: chloride channel protein [Anaeromyxobacteraceae bacterium]|nr:chloride channel protein [Anaeromyxobacteraceae bacterium]